MIGLDFFLQNLFKASVILAAALAAAWALRHREAALRHFVWTAALGALLILPVLIAMAPQWGWRVVPEQEAALTVTPTTASAAAVVSHGPAMRPAPVRPYWLPVAWAVGFLIVAVRSTLGAVRSARMVGRAAPLTVDAPEIGSGVRLLESREAPMPLAWGIRRPAVVLPVEARDWPADRLRTVVLHEWMHILRRDLLAQAVGQAACCLFWFHPLAWVAARQLRRERERACDDAVLLRGIAAHDYAGHLVELVRAMAARKQQWASAAGMAERSDLEARVRALLDRRRARQPLSRRAALTVSIAAAAMLLPLAALTTYAQATRGVLAGVVQDPSGARVPGATIIARNLDGSNQETMRADAAGQYRFDAIPPGHYELSVQSRGFATANVPALVTAGAVARVDASLEVGSILEDVTVTAQGTAAALTTPPAANPQRIRIGGMVQAAQLIKQQRPVYPADARQEGVTGIVMIKGVVSKTGDLLSPKVINAGVDPRLAKAALDAAGQWKYEPARLNGEPVEVLTTIRLAFELDQ